MKKRRRKVPALCSALTITHPRADCYRHFRAEEPANLRAPSTRACKLKLQSSRVFFSLGVANFRTVATKKVGNFFFCSVNSKQIAKILQKIAKPFETAKLLKRI
jgi:hypothetical protein